MLSNVKGMRAHLLALVLAASMLLWAATIWLLIGRVELAADWNGWRQADTQTIALNLLDPRSSLFFPRIAWGGAGPAYVEAEFQLYPQIVAALFQVFGTAEWPGRLISTLATLATGWMLWIHLSPRHSTVAALGGVATFFGIRTVVHLASVVMPDAMALFFFVTAWTFFTRYTESSRTRDLVIYAITGTLAMLIKPSTALLGVASLVFLLLKGWSALKERRIWVAWCLMLGTFGAYYVHAHAVYAEYGNTFGILTGQDSKVPKLHHLLLPSLHLHVLGNTVRWGVGYVAVVAAVVLLLRRRLTREHIALGIAVQALALVAFRVVAQETGNYYFAPATVLGASLVAALFEEVLAMGKTWRRPVAMTAVGSLLALQLAISLKHRQWDSHFSEPSTERVLHVAEVLSGMAQANDLVVMRSQSAAFNAFWGVVINYHDPRGFYLSKTHGWVVSADDRDLVKLGDAVAQGARYFADPVPEGNPTVDGWLRQHASLVWTDDKIGRIWRFSDEK